MSRRGHAPDFPACPVPVPSPRQVPQRSPLRYPGGKSRLIPHMRLWVADIARTTGRRPGALVEPFAGGGIMSLTAAAEDLAAHVFMGDADPEIANLWRTCLSRGARLADEVLEHRLSKEAPRPDDPDPVRRALGTLVRNRTRYNGNLTTKAGRSTPANHRWYGRTVADRIRAVYAMRSRITFREADWRYTAAAHRRDETAVFFIDPPYRRRGKPPLYSRRVIDQSVLFAFLADIPNEFMMTCESTCETAGLIRTHGFCGVSTTMRNASNRDYRELLVTRSAVFTSEAAARHQSSDRGSR